MHACVFAAPEIVLLGYAVLNDCVILQWKVYLGLKLQFK